MTNRELMQQALDALQESKPIDINDPAAFYRSAHAIEALRTRLAQPEQEWKWLTDEEANQLTYASIAEIEAKLKEKNA